MHFTNFSNLSGDLRDNLTYMFREPEWRNKVLIGAILSLIPFINVITIGYSLNVIQNVRKDESPVLPGWGDKFGKFFMDGLILAAIGVIYFLPALFVYFVGMYLLNSSQAVGFLGFLLLIYSIGMIFWMQGVLVNYSIRNTFSAAFEFDRILKIITTGWPRMLLTVGITVLGAIIMYLMIIILVLIPCLGWILAFMIALGGAFYLLLSAAYNIGFIARNSDLALVSTGITEQHPAELKDEVVIDSSPQEVSGVVQEKPKSDSGKPGNLGGWEDL